MTATTNLPPHDVADLALADEGVRRIEWAEREGYEIGVCTNADLEEHPEVLDGAHLYLSVGHDEYWSMGMRDTVEAFIARGGNAAFFSGNTSLWQVRIEGDEGEVVHSELTT